MYSFVTKISKVIDKYGLLQSISLRILNSDPCGAAAKYKSSDRFESVAQRQPTLCPIVARLTKR